MDRKMRRLIIDKCNEKDCFCRTITFKGFSELRDECVKISGNQEVKPLHL